MIAENGGLLATHFLGIREVKSLQKGQAVCGANVYEGRKKMSGLYLRELPDLLPCFLR